MRKIYPVVVYTHCLLKRPVKVFRYKKLSCKNIKIVFVFAKILAVIHDYILCYENDYGIKYGHGWD
jgi:hypothetical protein